MGYGEAVSLSPLEGYGQCPSPEFFLVFDLKIVDFGVF